ncbi:response regulator transcription factor [Qipengyuania nanhaisediminis]|uniref:response regulator transcription factor n=1 Tax=Qipengyuania nanhaisediminis TaxID=604088 RepID=UPI0038B2EF61
MRIAIADDDPELLEQLGNAIDRTAHHCERFRSGTELATFLKRETCDVVLVDWNMPGRTGLELVQWATQSLRQPPAFIILTSRSDKSDVVQGLEAGAIDYVVKPESEEVILARIEAAARRINDTGEDRIATFGGYTIDRVSRTVSRDGELLNLTNKEAELAILFFENVNRPLSRAYIFGEVWGSVPEVESRTLDLHVSRIRSKLELRPKHGFAIQTVFGFGYRMDRIVDNCEAL